VERWQGNAKMHEKQKAIVNGINVSNNQVLKAKIDGDTRPREGEAIFEGIALFGFHIFTRAVTVDVAVVYANPRIVYCELKN